MCHFEVILEKVTYMVILYNIYILYKYKDKISIFGQLKTGLTLLVTSLLCYFRNFIYKFKKLWTPKPP